MYSMVSYTRKHTEEHTHTNFMILDNHYIIIISLQQDKNKQSILDINIKLK